MQYEIGVYGLGVMGASIARNILNNGFSAAVYSVLAVERDNFPIVYYGDKCKVCISEEAFLVSLERPRKIFIMITAGRPVDIVLESLCPKLDKGDTIFDGGNSYYKDTDRRCEYCEEYGIHYVGAGVSGGQFGALYGPSIMLGGSLEGFRAGEAFLKAIAANYEDNLCYAYIGKGGSGHYVKMVHNGIEYAILELIGEAYTFMRNGLSFSHVDTLSIFREWRVSALSSYLIDISVQAMEKYEEDGTPLIDCILDVAEQKGTGKWTIQEAIERGVYTPGIYEAVLARSFSGKKNERDKGADILSASLKEIKIADVKRVLGDALLLAMALSYSQGMELIQKASKDYGWNIDVPILVDIWRGGCIIRSQLLTDIRKACEESKSPAVLTDAFERLRRLEPSLRRIVIQGERAGLAVTGFSAALHYYDYYRTVDMPVRFVQALRDCFGAHTYMRNDQKGHFHTEW